MIAQLHPNDYGKVLALCRQGVGRHPIIEGILCGNNRGRVYVDAPENPGSALVWAQSEMFYLIGSDPAQEFWRSLPKVLFEQIAPEALAVGDDFFQVELFPAAVWAPKVEAVLQRFLLKPYRRVVYIFNPSAYHRLPEWRGQVPEGVRIERIDAALLASDRDGVIRDEIHKFWTSSERFLEHGIGYCAMVGNRPVTCCLSVYAGAGAIEIGINTFRRADRNRGLGTLTARAVLDYAAGKGLIPHWRTESFRHASQRLAEKLGFESRHEYTAYYYAFRQTDNEIATAYYHLAHLGDRGAAAAIVATALERGELSADNEFLLACGYGAAGERALALTHLEAAIGKGWRDTGNVRFENDLQGLYGEAEWRSLLCRLEAQDA